MSAKPTIIFRLEMAQPLYVIALDACAASSRMFATKYRHRGGVQLHLIIACFHWKPRRVLSVKSSYLHVAVSLESVQI